MEWKRDSGVTTGNTHLALVQIVNLVALASNTSLYVACFILIYVCIYIYIYIYTLQLAPIPLRKSAIGAFIGVMGVPLTCYFIPGRDGYGGQTISNLCLRLPTPPPHRHRLLLMEKDGRVDDVWRQDAGYRIYIAQPLLIGVRGHI